MENAAAVAKWVVDHTFQNVGISSVAGHRQIRNGANPGSGLAPTILKLVAPRPGRMGRYSVTLSAMLMPGYIGLHR